MLGLAATGRQLLPPLIAWGCLAAGIVLLPLYWLHARRMAHPVLRLDLMAYPTYRVAVLGGSLFRIGTGAIPFLLPLMLQVGFGLDALHSGLITFAAAAGAMFVKALAPKILRRFGFRQVMVANAVMASAFLAINGLYTAQTSHWIMVSLLFLGGCLRSVQFTCVNAIAYADLETREMSAGTSLASVAQQLSLSLGVTLGALALEGAAGWHGRTEIAAGDFGPAFFCRGADLRSLRPVVPQARAGGGSRGVGADDRRRPRNRVAGPGLIFGDSGCGAGRCPTAGALGRASLPLRGRLGRGAGRLYSGAPALPAPGAGPGQRVDQEPAGQPEIGQHQGALVDGGSAGEPARTCAA